MSKVITFSGGCFSGKTTTMNAVKAYLEDAGYKVVVLGELIRTATDKPIDEIRKDPTAYLHLQEKIIRSKIEQENKALEDNSDTVYLADRAITDSLFYLQNYVDKSGLSDDGMIAYCKLHKEVIEHANKVFGIKEPKYFAVIEFSPIHGQSNDKYRPKHIDFSKEYEYDAIRILNNSFATRLLGDILTTQIIRVDLNKDSLKELLHTIKYKIEHHKLISLRHL